MNFSIIWDSLSRTDAGAAEFFLWSSGLPVKFLIDCLKRKTSQYFSVFGVWSTVISQSQVSIHVWPCTTHLTGSTVCLWTYKERVNRTLTVELLPYHYSTPLYNYSENVIVPSRFACSGTVQKTIKLDQSLDIYNTQCYRESEDLYIIYHIFLSFFSWFSIYVIQCNCTCSCFKLTNCIGI